VIQKYPQQVFQAIDINGGGVVLFDEFAHWALWNHMYAQDGDDDDGVEEALEVLRKQKPNLCGKDLSSIKASRAKYRADARISGQGCLGGDPSLAGGYDEIPDGGKELANGRHYPGGLAAWKASFHGKAKEDSPGRYRSVAKNMFVSDSCEKGGERVAVLPCGTEVEVVEVVPLPDSDRVRAKIADPEGWVSLMNTRNGFRWAVKLRRKGREGGGGGYASRAMDSGGMMCEKVVEEDLGAGNSKEAQAMREVEEVLGTAWKDSLERVEEADEAYEEAGIPKCINGCGQPRFGRYMTCCTHCRGEDGPHAQSCVKTGYEPCVHGCGHAQFGKYNTCCTHCRGCDGPHARGCVPIAPRDAGPSSPLVVDASSVSVVQPARPQPGEALTFEGMLASGQRAISQACVVS